MRASIYKLLLLLIAFAVTSGIAHAQLISGFGLKAGAVVANQTWDYTTTGDLSTDSRVGFTATGFVELLDLPFFSVLTEIQYTQKGMSVTVPVTTAYFPDGTGEYKTLGPRVGYLAIPLLAKLRFSLPVAEPYLIAGPRLDLLLSAKGDGFEVVTDKFEKREWGATVGGGVELNLFSPVQLLAECRYNFNLRNSFDNGFLGVRNRSIDFMLGIRLQRDNRGCHTF